MTFKTDAGPVPVKIDRITAILFNPALRRKQSVKAHSQRAWAGFSDGSRLLATALVVQGDSLKVTAAGQTLAAMRSPLVFLQPLAGRAMYLSDLRPAEYRQTPYLLPSLSGEGPGVRAAASPETSPGRTVSTATSPAECSAAAAGSG